MLRILVICPDQAIGASLERTLLETRNAAVVLNLNVYPDPVELDALISERSAEVVFLSFDSPSQAAALATVLEKRASRVPVVAVSRASDQRALLEMMRAGVREVVSPPFEQRILREALGRILELLDRQTGAIERLYTFLPSKAGVGASTIALNTSIALSRIPDTSVLLMDFDLNNGLIGFMLKLTSRYSILDAVEHAHELDQDIWAKLVWPMGRLDVLPTGPLNPGIRIDPAQLHPLLAFARRYYKVICVDLSGMMEKYSIELMKESGRIFMVCTPEVPSLHLGAEKLRYFRGLDLADRVEILLNRAQARGVLSRAEIERMLGTSVRMTIPNDYTKVHEAMIAGQAVDPSSRLGKCFNELAGNLMELGLRQRMR